MLDKEDLLAISQLTDTKLQENNKIDVKFDAMAAKIDASAEETRRHFDEVIESKVMNELRLIIEYQKQILDRLPEADTTLDQEDRKAAL